MVRERTVESLPDYYGILGVPRYTSHLGIRRAYLRLAREHHPDLNPDEPAAISQMSVINAAYATLSNPSRRADYDTRRNTAYLRVSPDSLTEPMVYSSSHPHESSYHHSHHKVAEPGVLSAAVAVLQRLLRYVTATFPA